jgi:hypothetical protein
VAWSPDAARLASASDDTSHTRDLYHKLKRRKACIAAVMNEISRSLFLHEFSQVLVELGRGDEDD